MSDQVLSQEEVDALFLNMTAEKKEGNKSVMSGKYENIAQSLRKLGEDIDTAGLNDPEAWRNISVELSAVKTDISGETGGLNGLLDTCIRGLNALAEKKVEDALSLVDAIYEGLTASEQYLGDAPDRDSLVADAESALNGILGAESEKDEAKAEPESFTLDDAAALLIQVEPEDTGELVRLRSLLENISGDESHDEPMKNKIKQAAEKIDEIVKKDAADPDSALTEAGGLIEDALKALSEKEKVSKTVTYENGSEATKILETPAKPETGPDLEAEEKPEAVEPETVAPQVLNVGEPPAQEADDDTDYMPSDAEPELLGAFITESSELITNAEDALLSLETNPEDMEAIGSVFRAFHTIKGTAAFLELSLISEMGHHAESLLSRVREREIRYSGGYADLSLKTLDMIKELIFCVQDALGGKPFYKPAGYNQLMSLLENPEKAGITEDSEDIDSEPEQPPVRVGDILIAQGKIKQQDVEKALENSGDEAPIGTKLVKSKAATVTDVAHALRTQRTMEKTRKQVVESSVRVPTERLDRFIDTVGELVVAHSMVAQDDIVASGNHHELFKKVTHTSKIVRELQDMSMSMRMIPFKATFRKMARLVRDLARKIGKNVMFVSEGEDTEIDRNMVDIINDPLVHMVRNAIDHGIELPDVRQKVGKPPNGTLKLSAYHSAGSVVVEIEDDGKGLDKDAILAKAMASGLVSDGSAMTDREIFNMIFEPGFSTAKVVSDVSGRGVGMDVVKKNIENLRGSVEIQSKPGKGSVFKMSLPLTLAIIDGMVVRVGTEKYVIPTVSIIRSVKPEPGNLSSVLHRGEMITLQGKLIPLFRLSRLFEIEGAEQDPTKALVVVVENHMSQAGLMIDELIGTQQIVIKTLGETMGNIPGISGSAIMPNGRVGLILDVGGLVRLANAGADEA